ncbi:MAG: NAD-dependent succinate-semialdehyde dehydrogenase [Planctomycetes bacterium]|nr:NAD-dependent succinate-semialdehyde dehydrogenase [Planctomycetota bacterium]
MTAPALRGSLYVNGKWCEADSGRQIAVTNPATEDMLCEVGYGGRAETERSIAAAAKAFPSWRAMTAYERALPLKKTAELLRQRAEEIARALTMEQGKPLSEARLEVLATATFFEYFAEEGKRVCGEIVPASFRNKRLFILYQPVGVCAMISPWNFPLFLQGRKIAPALAAGCTCVARPSTSTPLNLIKLFECLDDAGLPPGVANLVLGPADECMEAFYAAPELRQISFSGSTGVGKQIMRRAADQVKKISIDLGGHAPFIALPDYGAEEAAKFAALSKFRNAGQSCIAASRFYVHQDIFDRFVEAAVAEAKKRVLGNGLDENVTMGPMAVASQRDKALGFVQDALSKGAKVLTGGRRPPHLPKGHFVEPTVLTGLTRDMAIMQEEPFCPVMPIIPFKSLDEALEMANDSTYGLASYVATRDIGAAIRLAEGLECGIVSIGDFSPATVQAPFGGWKESGIGREGGTEGIHEYLESKYVALAVEEKR